MTSVTGGGGLIDAKFMQDCMLISARMAKCVNALNCLDKPQNAPLLYWGKTRSSDHILTSYSAFFANVAARPQIDVSRTVMDESYKVDIFRWQYELTMSHTPTTSLVKPVKIHGDRSKPEARLMSCATRRLHNGELRPLAAALNPILTNCILPSASWSSLCEQHLCGPITLLDALRIAASPFMKLMRPSFSKARWITNFRSRRQTDIHRLETNRPT